MFRLADLLAGVGVRLAPEVGDRTVGEVREDSRQVRPGDLFVAVPGTKADGRRFVADALARGAAAVLTTPGERGDAPGVAWIETADVRRALALVAANRHGGTGGLTLTGVTGTNGKTTTTYVLEAIFAAAGRRPGVVGTVAYRYAGREVEAPLTTPGALALHELFARMRDAGTTDVAMEVSSIALDQSRVAGCRYRVAGLTNVTQDHLDYHGTMDRYFAAKALLFRDHLTADGVGVVFADREDGRRMRAEIRGRVLTVSEDRQVAADVVVDEVTFGEAGTRVVFATPSGRLPIDSPLVGGYNLSNLTLAVGMAIGHGLAGDAIAAGVAALRGVPGRLERVPNAAGVLCLVDYAHTPDALERAIAAVRPVTAGRLFVVFGCGGDRDPTKRPIMGEVAAAQADLAIVTSDNPRTERPEAIVEMILGGVRRTTAPERDASSLPEAARGYHVEVDRRAAIRRAIAAARPGDAILIAGKGHEDYQIIGSEKVHFDDREEAAAAFAVRAERPDR